MRWFTGKLRLENIILAIALIALGVLLVLVRPFLEEGFLYDSTVELLGGTALVAVSALVLWRVRENRKSGLRELLRKHSFNLLGWVLFIEGLVKGEDWKDKEGNKYPNLLDQIGGNHVEPKDYVALFRALIRANEQAKRVIDINDTISADTILRLPSETVELIYRNTDDAYILVGNFEYILSRLGNRDLHRHGYGEFDLNEARDVLQTVVSDMDDFRLRDRLDDFVSTLNDVLIELGYPKDGLERLLENLQITATVNRVTGVPDVFEVDSQGQRVYSSYAAEFFVRSFEFRDFPQMAKHLRRRTKSL